MNDIRNIIQKLTRIEKTNNTKKDYFTTKTPLLKEIVAESRTKKAKNIIVEGRGDDLLSQFYASVQARHTDNAQVQELISELTNYWNRYRKNESYVAFPNNWKFAMAEFYKRLSVKQLSEILPDDQKLKSLSAKSNVNEFPSIRVFMQAHTQLEHFSAWANYPEVQNFDFSSHSTAESAIRSLQQITNEINKRESQWVKTTGKEQVILDFGQYKWYDLGVGGCGLEGKAMGHCGNLPSQRDGDRILSLRQVKKVGNTEMHRPSLTFILRNGYLGEMKGRANEKPNNKYHPYIVELLKNPIIKGISGGGYAPENNFSIDDLSPALKDELSKARGAEFMKEISEGELFLLTIQERINEYAAGNYDLLPSIVSDVDSYIYDDLNRYDDYAKIAARSGKLEIDVSFIQDAFGGYRESLENGYIDGYGGYDVPTEYDKIIDVLKKDGSLKTFISNLISTYRDDIGTYMNDNDDLDIDEMDESDVENYVIKNFESILSDYEFDEITTAYENAYYYADEVGAFDEMYRAAVELVDNVSREFGVDFGDKKYEIIEGSNSNVVLSPEQVPVFLKNYLRNEGFVTTDFKFEEPYYGFQGFSDETFAERLKDELYNNGLL